MKRIGLTAALLIGLSGVAGAHEIEMSGNELPPARDGNIAIQEELDAARRAGTIAAYDLFIARHPDHVLAETARRERAEILRRRRR